MKLFLKRLTVFALIFFLSVGFNSCSSHSREAICKGNYPHRGYNPKKNKSRFTPQNSNTNKSVRKDYVIKNGIAH
jgi:hypothetical protein